MQRVISLLSLFTLIIFGKPFPDVSTVSISVFILFWIVCDQRETAISILLFNPQRKRTCDRCHLLLRALLRKSTQREMLNYNYILVILSFLHIILKQVLETCLHNVDTIRLSTISVCCK